mgnify:FL=1
MISPEHFAVATAVAYLLLVIRQNIWCWFFAGLSTLTYIWVTFVAKLYMDTALQCFYFAMAVYGWYVWSAGQNDGHKKVVVVWPVSVHVAALTIIAVVSAANGFLLDTRTDAAFPYLDAATTWAAVWATFLVARKVLVNWWYWLVIDAVYVFLYWSRDLNWTAVLFVFYIGLIPIGLASWSKSMREQAA